MLEPDIFVMKVILPIFVLFCSLATAAAIIMPAFYSWDFLIASSSHIMVVSTSQCSYHSDGVATSDARVVSVLKGDGKTKMLLHLVTTYFPYDGQRLLIFFNGGLDQTNAEFDALGSCVVPINRFFPVKALTGKSLRGQIKLILKSRLNDLNAEINRDQEEKARLETFFKNGNAPTNTLKNAPVPGPGFPPTKH